MKKSVLSMICILILAAVMLSGCKKKAEETQDAGYIPAPVLQEIDPGNAKVGICIYRLEDDYMSIYSSELVRYLVEEVGFSKENIALLDGANSQATQNEQIGRCVSAGANLMIVNPIDPLAAPEITERVIGAGIPLIYINREPASEEQQRWGDNYWPVTYVGTDARQAGTMQGQILVDLGLYDVDLNHNGQIEYVMITGDLDSESTQYRTEFSTKAIEDAGMGVECLDQQVASGDRLWAKQIIATDLEQFGSQIEVVFCNNDTMALGAMEAIEEAGRVVNEDIFLVGIDALPEALEALMEGRITGTVLQDQFAQAEAAGKAAANFLQADRNEYHITCDYVKVMPGNAPTILSRMQ